MSEQWFRTLTKSALTCASAILEALEIKQDINLQYRIGYIVDDCIDDVLEKEFKNG